MFATTAPAALDARPLLAEFQALTTERLGVALESALRLADDYLFDRSAQAAEGTELTALRDLRRARAPLRQGFEAALRGGFQRLSSGPLPPAPLKRELNLLSDDALEEQLASEQMVDGLSRRHAVPLELLEQRIAVLVERSALAAGDNPAGPMALGQATRDALAGVELSTSVRIALYKFMERELATVLTPLYDRLNARLADAGILPRLLPTTPLVSEAPAATGAAPSVAADSTATTESATNDHTLFSNLIGMLQSWRQQSLPADVRRSGTSAPLAVPQLMSALSLLQSDPPEAIEHAMGDARVSLAELLRREVLAGARRLGMGGDDINLSPVQEDAVDLVGMLFDVLLDERDFEPDVRRKIGRMLVPYVKVAVQDRRMFVFKGHPARRFLNAIAEACEGNHGDVPQERDLLAHVDAAIDRLVAEFNEDVAIFETLEQELRAYMAQHRQRIDIAERRAAETQRGRERLEQARTRAVADVAMRRVARQLPVVLEDLLSGYATHHLTQLGLRGSADSEPYAHALGTLDGLLATFDAATRHTPVAELPAFDREGLSAVLASSGCVGSSADEAIALIERSLHAIAQASSVDVESERLPSPAVTSPEPPPAPPALEIVGGHDALDFDPAMAERIRALPIGTWMQLTGVSGRSEPAKISWVSPISSRLLFVNRRGVRVLVASAEELAAMEKAGQVQLRPTGRAFDDALQQMVGRLQTRSAA